MPNLINAERLSHAYGTRTLLDSVSVGLGAGESVGVVGRNGDGKTTLLQLLTGALTPDAGRVTRTQGTSVGYLHQADDFAPDAAVRDVLVDGAPDHVWAARPAARAVVTALLADVDLDAPVHSLSGGERRRTALAGLLLADPDVLVLDEPTNHLDVEAVAWLATELRARPARGRGLLVVSHDRWFLDAICTRIWEVHDGAVDAYEGGYAAYVLARAERARQAAGMATRRRNLLRKELAWLRRGAPARTSKPRFRVDAATALIADEPPPRDTRELSRLATRRLGKDVFDLDDVTLTVPAGEGRRTLLDHLTWSIGPGARIGLVGVNGAGKTSLLRLLTGESAPDSGTVRRGRTLTLGYLSQAVEELWGPARVLDSVNEVRQVTALASGREVSATSLLEDFGFRGDTLTARLDDLSGGERRRLQLLRLLLAEPNVLLLDEPTNDLDIDTLTVVEDYLDSWPGTLIVVTHDRYFLERVCDVTYALRGDGSCVLLPGGVEQYLEQRRTRTADVETAAPGRSSGPTAPGGSAAARRQAGKELVMVERRHGRVSEDLARVAAELAGHDPSDYAGLSGLTERLTALQREESDLESRWLELAEQAG